MEGHIRIRCPQSIRPILREWGHGCDPALIPLGNHDRQTLCKLYCTLAEATEAVDLDRRMVRAMYFNAHMNSRFGLVSEVRREGRLVTRWVESVMARDPLLRQQLAEPESPESALEGEPSPVPVR